MKKLLVLALMSGLISGAAIAQEQKDMKTDHKEWDTKVKTELALTDEQVVKYDAISKEYGDKIDAVMNDASLTKEAQKEKKMELKKEKQAKLFEFFTPEQQTKYNAMIEKKKAEKPKEKSISIQNFFMKKAGR
jgi:flavin-dependent dehydrogenase